MKDKIDQLSWHDSEILGIKIDRSSPGEQDTIEINIKWPNETANKIRFTDCYKAKLDLNMGIIASESILSASTIEDETLKSIKDKWSKLNVDLVDLCCFQIKTASTGGEIKIYCKSFEIL